MKIGIFGGSFNPIHLGHLIVAETFTDELKLDLTLFVPAFCSPFKHRYEYFITDEHRIKILELTLKENHQFCLELYEIEQERISYTIDTIEYLRKSYPDDEYYLLIGMDQALEFKKWHEWERILDSVQVCIANRNDPKQMLSLPYIESELTYKNKKPIFIQSPLIEISSSDIRERIKQEKSIRYLVNRKVEWYISKHGLYL
jgi:nicotinate-nucleotide adenylyltransferase